MIDSDDNKISDNYHEFQQQLIKDFNQTFDFYPSPCDFEESQEQEQILFEEFYAKQTSSETVNYKKLRFINSFSHFIKHINILFLDSIE